MIKNKKAYNNVCENAHQQLYTTWDKVCRDVLIKYEKIVREFKK
jgi:hypothetical protein